MSIAFLTSAKLIPIDFAVWLSWFMLCENLNSDNPAAAVTVTMAVAVTPMTLRPTTARRISGATTVSAVAQPLDAAHRLAQTERQLRE